MMSSNELENHFRERELRRYKKTCEEQDKMNRVMIVVFLIILLSMGIQNYLLGKKNADYIRQIQQYKIFYNDIQSDIAYQAVKKCDDSGNWKPECIAWEMNKHNAN